MKETGMMTETRIDGRRGPLGRVAALQVTQAVIYAVVMAVVLVNLVTGPWRDRLPLGTAVALVTAVLGGMALLSLACAVGLWKRRRWSRYLGILLGFLQMFNLPLGTLMGGYTLYVLLDGDLSRMERPAR